MNIFKYLFSILALVGVLSQPATAQSLSANDLGFAFGSDMTSELTVVGLKQSDVVFMTEEEMHATEGEWIGLALRGALWVGSRIQTWVRFGDSYSKSSNCPTCAIRWGSNRGMGNKYIKNPTLRSWNRKLSKTRLPGNSWRTRDPGHFHLWRK